MIPLQQPDDLRQPEEIIDVVRVEGRAKIQAVIARRETLIERLTGDRPHEGEHPLRGAKTRCRFRLENPDRQERKGVEAEECEPAAGRPKRRLQRVRRVLRSKTRPTYGSSAPPGEERIQKKQRQRRFVEQRTDDERDECGATSDNEGDAAPLHRVQIAQKRRQIKTHAQRGRKCREPEPAGRIIRQSAVHKRHRERGAT